MNTITLNPEHVLTFNFKKAGITRNYKLGELPLKTIYALLQYGTRKGNDTVNSAFSEDQSKPRAVLVDEFCERLLSGNFGQRKTAGSSFEIGFRNYLRNLLKNAGLPAKVADKMETADCIKAILKAGGKPLTPETVEKASIALAEKYRASLAAVADILGDIPEAELPETTDETDESDDDSETDDDETKDDE